MKSASRNVTGLERLIEKYRKIFRIPENLDHYSKTDFMAAEKKFIKWALRGGDPRRVELLRSLTR